MTACIEWDRRRMSMLRDLSFEILSRNGKLHAPSENPVYSEIDEFRAPRMLRLQDLKMSAPSSPFSYSSLVTNPGDTRFDRRCSGRRDWWSKIT